MKHVMVDLETLDTQPGAAILSIGAVLFNSAKPPEECLGGEFYRVVHVPTCEALGMTISRSTLDWWESQSSEARAVLEHARDSSQSVDIHEALADLRDFLPKDVKVWSNGANFDQPLLDVAYNRIGGFIPWKYYNSRCYRTIISLHPSEKEMRPATVLAHNALEDAKWQARHLVNIARTLNLKLL